MIQLKVFTSFSSAETLEFNADTCIGTLAVEIERKWGFPSTHGLYIKRMADAEKAIFSAFEPVGPNLRLGRPLADYPAYFNEAMPAEVFVLPGSGVARLSVWFAYWDTLREADFSTWKDGLAGAEVTAVVQLHRADRLFPGGEKPECPITLESIDVTDGKSFVIYVDANDSHHLISRSTFEKHFQRDMPANDLFASVRIGLRVVNEMLRSLHAQSECAIVHERGAEIVCGAEKSAPPEPQRVVNQEHMLNIDPQPDVLLNEQAFSAAKRRRWVELSRFINEGAEPTRFSRSSGSSTTFLHLLAKSGPNHVVENAMRHGMDFTMLDGNGTSALYFLLESRSINGSMQRFIIDSSYDYSDVMKEGKNILEMGLHADRAMNSERNMGHLLFRAAPDEELLEIVEGYPAVYYLVRREYRPEMEAFLLSRPNVLRNMPKKPEFLEHAIRFKRDFAKKLIDDFGYNINERSPIPAYGHDTSTILERALSPIRTVMWNIYAELGAEINDSLGDPLVYVALMHTHPSRVNDIVVFFRARANFRVPLGEKSMSAAIESIRRSNPRYSGNLLCILDTVRALEKREEERRSADDSGRPQKRSRVE